MLLNEEGGSNVTDRFVNVIYSIDGLNYLYVKSGFVLSSNVFADSK